LKSTQIDKLAETEEGEDRQEAPEDKEERLRDAILKARIRDRPLIRDLIDDH
jgi:hypothetical protein